MRPVLKGADSPDADPLDGHVPADPDNFGYLVQLSVGPVDSEGAELFDVMVCSVGWLRDEVRAEGVVSLRHYLVVDRFDWPAIRAFVECHLATIDGGSWDEVAEKVARFGKWEFEDYRPWVEPRQLPRSIKGRWPFRGSC